MTGTCVADEYGLLRHRMASVAVRCALIDSVTVIQAAEVVSSLTVQEAIGSDTGRLDECQL